MELVNISINLYSHVHLLHSEKKLFSIRIIPAWNFLPADIVTCRNVNDFNVKLLNIDLTLYLSRRLFLLYVFYQFERYCDMSL